MTQSNSSPPILLTTTRVSCTDRLLSPLLGFLKGKTYQMVTSGYFLICLAIWVVQHSLHDKVSQWYSGKGGWERHLSIIRWSKTMVKDFLGAGILTAYGTKKRNLGWEILEGNLKFEYSPSSPCANNTRQKRCPGLDSGEKIKAEDRVLPWLTSRRTLSA